ncbi:MAG TPA: hypothetical protein PKE04_12150, partial [Clostridia bacterium]|nr:hypothetical protein [Clostridia bacterium]
SINANAELTPLMYSVSTKERVTRLRKVVLSLPIYVDANRCVDSYYVYSAHHNMLLNDKAAYLHLSESYEYLFQYDDLDYAQWVAQVLRPVRQLRLLPAVNARGGRSVDERYLVYSLPYTLSSNGRVVGQILFYINEARILETLAPVFEVGAEFVLVSNRDGEILLSQARHTPPEAPFPELDTASGYETHPFQGESVYVSFVRSNRYGLSYQIGIPHSVIQEECRVILNMNLMIVSVLILVGLLAAALSIRSSHMPLLRMMERLFPGRNGHAGRPGLKDMERAVNTLLSDNDAMQQKLDQNKAQLRDALLNQLIQGDIGDEASFERQLEHVEMQLPADPQAVRGVYLKLRAAQPQNNEALRGGDIRRVLAQEALRKYAPTLTPLTLAGQDVLALLYCRNADEEDLEILREIYQTLKNLYNVDVVFYVGRESTELYRVYRSFASARRLMQKDAEPDEHILVVDDHPSSLEAYAYSPRDEERLLNLTALGDAEEVDAALARIHENNFTHRSLSPTMRELLYFRMLSTAMLCEYRVELCDAALLQPQADTPPEAFFSALSRHYGSMCAHALSARQHEKAQLDEALLAFLHARFADSEMSLTMLSVQFGRTESYLSARLKTLLGDTHSWRKGLCLLCPCENN